MARPPEGPYPFVFAVRLSQRDAERVSALHPMLAQEAAHDDERVAARVRRAIVRAGLAALEEDRGRS